MSEYLIKPHVNELLEQQPLSALCGMDATVFSRVVESYPWKGLALDWEVLQPHLVLSLVEPEDTNVMFHRLAEVVGHLVLVYTEHEAIGGSLDTVLEHFDELVWGAPGRRYLVGAQSTDGRLMPVAGVIVEYDGADTMRLFFQDRDNPRR